MTDLQTEQDAPWQFTPPSEANIRFDVRYELEPEDMIVLFSQMQKRQLTIKQTVLMVVLLPAFWFFFKFVGDSSFSEPPLHYWLSELPQLLCAIGAGIVLAIWLIKGLQHLLIKAQFNRNPGSLRNKQIHVTVFDDHVLSVADVTQTLYTWQSFFKVTRSEEHTLFWVQRNMALVVPDRAFETPDDAMQMYLFANEKHQVATQAESKVQP